ncbi:hypothetical protein HK100_010121, partial [Physocladia obscura]
TKKANFDATHELEEILLDEMPLQAKPRRKNFKNGYIYKMFPKEAEIIETKFLVFDHTKLQPFAIRKKSTAWDNKLSEIRQGQSLFDQDSKLDLMENRSAGILIDPEYLQESDAGSFLVSPVSVTKSINVMKVIQDMSKQENKAKLSENKD